MHLVGFIIRIYDDARSSECQIHCELYQVCHFCVTELSFKDSIKIGIKLTARSFSFFMAIRNVFVFVD